MKFVSLHSHSTFSFGDGIGTPLAHMERVAELGGKALALTEHGSTSSHVQLERAATKLGGAVKPIYGLEAYTAGDLKSMRKWHLTILAMNQQGYVNLNRLVTRSYKEGYFRYPTITGPMLAEHNEGLIVLSGCADSLLACTLLGGKGREVGSEREALRVIQKFKRLFGNRYFLEVQMFPELERTRTLNRWLAEAGHRLNIPLATTPDSHYCHPDDNQIQLTLHAASRGANSVAEQASGWEYDIRLTHPTSDAAVLERLRGTGLTSRQADAALAVTSEIADRCNVILPKSERLRFPVEPGLTAEETIWQLLRDGWAYRKRTNHLLSTRQKEYVNRLRYEMEMITAKDYVDYFLLTSEAVRWAKDNGIAVGPARGSAAASFVCYLLRITEVDPMQFPTMVFERFIDWTREDLPDIDLDFASNRRDEVRLHLVDIYGADRVGNIGSFTRFRGKNSIDTVARVNGIPPWETKIVKDLVLERAAGDERFDSSLADTFTLFPQAAEVLERWPVLSQAIALEGNYAGMSVHAAGVVVANTPLTDVCAVYEREVGVDKRKLQALAYDKKDAEYLGMLKMDFLGLSTMQMISDALGFIGMTLEELYAIPLDEPVTLKAFRKSDVTGIFQFEGRSTRLVNRDVKPDNFMELADINALSRPGPLFSGTTANYIAVKHGRAEPLHLHPVVDAVSEHSKFQIIYQEQVLTIVREMGGFPATRVAEIRKAISQSLGGATFNTMFEEFVQGAKDLHGVSPELSQKIWNYLVSSSSYSFNVSHSVSYAMLAFWVQYLKQHHPEAFYAAQMTELGGGKNELPKLQRLMRDAESHGTTVKPPSLTRSVVNWRPSKGAVWAGFNQIPGIGAKVAGKIVESRDEENFKEWNNLTRISGVGPKTVTKIREFCESDDPFELDRIGRLLRAAREAIKAGELQCPTPTHTSDEILEGERVTWIGVPIAKDYKDFIEEERSRTGEDPDEITAKMKDKHLTMSCVLRCIDDGKEEEVRLKFNRWKYPRFRAQLKSIRVDQDIIVATGVRKSNFGLTLHVEKMTILYQLKE